MFVAGEDFEKNTKPESREDEFFEKSVEIEETHKSTKKSLMRQKIKVIMEIMRGKKKRVWKQLRLGLGRGGL